MTAQTGEVLASQKRVAGSRWTIYGPTIYFVPVEVGALLCSLIQKPNLIFFFFFFSFQIIYSQVNIIAKYKSMIEIGNLNALFFSKAPFQNDFAA